jgi:hypothetical protein
MKLSALLPILLPEVIFDRTNKMAGASTGITNLTRILTMVRKKTLLLHTGYEHWS